MTIAVEVIKANTLADLESAINALFTAWIAGASRTVYGVSIILNDSERLLGTEYQAIITTNDAGAAAQAAAYEIHLLQDKSATGLEAAINTQIAAAATAFWTGARVISQDIPSRINLLTAWLVSAPVGSIAAATTNWAPR